MTGPDLSHHGDAESEPGLLDLAVNVRVAAPPAWLQARLAATLPLLAAYPKPGPARAAVARRHHRTPAEVLLTAGGAEAFVLLARVLDPRRAVCVHPSFTEPEAALRAAGIDVERVILAPPFDLEAAAIPEDADLVVLGNPTNPTSRLHPADVLAALARPGRTLVVDEAFADAVPGESESLAQRTDLPGLVVVRSLTKTWGLAGLRVGYLLAAPDLVARLAEAQPLWAVSTPALAALEACSEPAAVSAAADHAAALGRARDDLARELNALDGLEVASRPQAPFLLLQGPPDLREALRHTGITVRRGDTFPGLDDTWVRLAVPPRGEHAGVLRAFRAALTNTATSQVPHQAPTPRTGLVTLVGAGPGPADLLTFRGHAALHDADVIVTDRLVSADLLDGLRPGVEIVEVGKAPGRHAATQDDINAVLVDRAHAGHHVVRLKGGDPFVFGRGGEELLACGAAGIETRVVPGLSSAIAVPTLAGVPVTHRGLTQSFTVVSGHLPPGDPGSTVDWGGLARSTETLVLLMGVARLPAIVDALVNGGRASTTPLVAIENGGTPRQRLVRTTLADAASDVAAAELRNPAVVVIGTSAAAVHPVEER